MSRKTAFLLILFITVIAAAAGTAYGESELSEGRRITAADISVNLLTELQNEWERCGNRWVPDESPQLSFLFNDALPKIQYELPSALVGQFILVSHSSSRTLFMFPNNKFIEFDEYAHHPIRVTYGYIIKINDEWWLYDAPESSLSGPAKIHLEESEVSIGTYGSQRAIRKEDMPMPEHLAQGISVEPWRKAKREYFTFCDSWNGTVDFYEIEGFRDSSYRYFQLRIDNGIVRMRCIWSPGEYGTYFDGFIDIIENTSDCLRGIVRFTNGVPYHFVDSGTANIEINSDGSIIITMLYSPQPEYISKYIKEIPELQFPAMLVLEF